MLTMFPHCLQCDRTKRTYEEHELVAQDADDKVKKSFCVCFVVISKLFCIFVRSPTPKLF